MLCFPSPCFRRSLLPQSGLSGWYVQFYNMWHCKMDPTTLFRVYVPGPWQPVAESTLGPAPDDTTTYREWRKFYHFDVYWPSESTGGTTMGSVSQPVSYASFYTWQYRDWVTRGYQRLGHPRPNIARPVFASGSPDLMYAGLSSSSASSNSDGG